MVFYYFGPDPSSWALGNDKFALARNLPTALQAVWDGLGEPFQDKQLAGTRIEWMTSAPDGSYAVMTKDGTLLSNCAALLAAVRSQIEQVYGTSVEYVTFSPLGGWFIRYCDGTVQLSGHFPKGFRSIASPFIDFSEAAATTRQTSSVQYVLFGADDAIVVKVETGLHYENIPQDLVVTLKNMIPGRLLFNQFFLGKNSVLCPWSSEYFFIEAQATCGEPQYPFHLPDGELSQELLMQVTSNSRPPQHLIPDDAENDTDSHVNLSSSSIPTEMRQVYEDKFDTHSRGQTYISGKDAVSILLESGLSIEMLSKTWELIDLDKNGQLDKEEFVQAMCLIDKQKTPVRHTIGGLRCDACMRGIRLDEMVYFCTVCRGGDFDLCETCYMDEEKRCAHEMVRGAIELQHPEFLYAPAGYLICDGCRAQVCDGSYVYWCPHCNRGDYEVCQECWIEKKTCGHTLLLRKLKGPASWESTDLAFPPPLSSIGDNWTPHGSPEVDRLSQRLGDTHLSHSLLTSIMSSKPNVQWDDVAGLVTAKKEVQEALIFPLRFPQMFKGKRQPRKALLLYGPPGTGKSYLAKAVATEIDHTLFSVSSSDIMSKWVGESEKLMRRLFELAREKKPSIIFIDEIDALCGKRDGGSGHEDTHRVKTEFLVQMDGVGNDNEGVFVLAATNLPWMLDPAVRRRFQKRVHAPLPDEDARKRLFEVHLGDMAVNVEGFERGLGEMAKTTEGCSGSDIANMVQDALMIPIRKVHTAQYFRKVHEQGNVYYMPCHKDADGAMAMRWNQVPSNQLQEPALTMEDLTAASSNMKPSIGEEEIMKCNEWTAQYGLEGA